MQCFNGFQQIENNGELYFNVGTGRAFQII